jgi:hypothetical protein
VLPVTAAASGRDGRKPTGRGKNAHVFFPASMPMKVRALLVVCAVGAIAIFVGAYRANRDPSSNSTCNQPAAIDTLFPQCNVQVLNQSQVGVDMAAGYTADLTLNGVAIPLDQLEHRPAASTVDLRTAPDLFVFTPGPGKAVEKLKPGLNEAIVFYRKLSENEATTVSFHWFFNAN